MIRPDVDPLTTLGRVLSDALIRVAGQIPKLNGRHNSRCQPWSEAVRDAWVAALRGAFESVYCGVIVPAQYEVYGGKPEADREVNGPNRPRMSWPRWEFLYDVTVLEMTEFDAAYSPLKHVRVAKRAIWQVESEIAKDGSAVAEDASKLRVGAGLYKLLVAAQTTRADQYKWLEFLGKLSRDAPGEWFLALMPPYASERHESSAWWERNVSVCLYRCYPEGTLPKEMQTHSMPIRDSDSSAYTLPDFA